MAWDFRGEHFYLYNLEHFFRSDRPSGQPIPGAPGSKDMAIDVGVGPWGI